MEWALQIGSWDPKVWNECDLVIVALTLVAMVTMATIKTDQNMYILQFQYVFTGVTLEICIKYQSVITPPTISTISYTGDLIFGFTFFV